MLHVVVAAPPTVRCPEDLARRLPACADVVELRLDLLEGAAADVRRWIASSPRPVLATVRSRAEGGAFTGTPEAAAHLLLEAAEAGAAWIDVERTVAPLVGQVPAGVRVVASYHGHAQVDLPAEVGDRRIDARKIARPVATALELGSLRDEAEAPEGDLPPTLVPYGPLGPARAAFTHASSLLYGSAGHDAAVVSGQPSLVELLDELRAGEVGPRAALYGLLGRPPARSPSPLLHNAVFRARGDDALYLPLPDLSLDHALQLPFRGFSVTTPYKTEALEQAADADETARACGAANTLTRSPKDGAWRASNTDAAAIEESVPDAEPGAGAFVYGAGGYARAAIVALARRGYEVRVGARPADETDGRRLTRELDVAWAGPRLVRGDRDTVVVNATPAGFEGEEPAFVAGVPLSGLVVLDAPYRRDGRPTGLVRCAQTAGALRVEDGLSLLVRQALAQARAFTGAAVDPHVMHTAMRGLPPLLLMGLRGAGKTSVGRAVARRLGRPFLDLDAEVARVTGHAPAWWIRQRGEPAFREIEADVAERLGGRRGVVVAAGGGVLEHARASAAVRTHTWPVWLEVPPETAAARIAADTADRPRLAGANDALTEALRLAERRSAGWRQTACHVVDASRSIDVVARDVAEAWSPRRTEP